MSEPNIEEFIENFKDAFEEHLSSDSAPPIRADTPLQAIPEWDSLAVMNLLAMINIEYDLTLEADDIRSIETVGDAYALVRDKLKD